MGVNGVNLGNEINKLESTKEEISSTTIINELMNNDNIQGKKAQEAKSEEEKYNKKELKKAVDEVNKYLVKDKTHAEYSVHEVFNRIMIKIIDDKTDESINKWFGKESDGRKDALRGKEFHIDNNLGL